ncbi:MAG: DJ-1 family glyoxalase III [Candidatus Cloacimonadota bacterium]|nr:DJ-1 family glyoxalase III [Candidatus Cloacimonadota bacterium]
MKKKVLVPISDGIEELEAIGIIDTLRRANANVTVASVDKLQITGSCGTRIIADKLIDECTNEQYDLIALPGGLPGAEHLRDSQVLTSLLKKQAADGKYYAAICASPTVVLQYHGLLDGKKATVNPALADDLIIQDEIDKRVVVDGNCITSKARGTVLEFAIQLIELLYDKSKAEKIKTDMLSQ